MTDEPQVTEQEEEGLDVEALQAERDQLFDRLQRLAAEFDNFRKRNAREQAALSERANERLVKELIPILDDLGRALEAAAEHEEAKLEEGVRLVHRSLSELLTKEGLAEIETDGKFDPHVHEALLSQPSDEEEGAVIEVVQKGYKLGDRVLRPARVVVSAPAAQPPVREADQGRGSRGNREVPPATEDR
jgi:molecular chaperone GrpE